MVENNMVSVERIREYQDEGGLEREAEGGAWPPEDQWPGEGAIEFKDYSVSYRACPLDIN